MSTLLLIVVSVCVACSDATDEPAATSTPATCRGVCFRQAELCGSTIDCEAKCKQTDDAVKECLCTAKAQRLYDCKSKLDVCDSDNMLCSALEHNECITGLCDPINCHNICLRQNLLCSTQTDCNAVCDVLNSRVAVSGCDKPFEDGLRCLREKDVCDQDETACPGTAFDACVDRFCETRPTDAICTG